MGFAGVDHHRALRTGVPEVVFCPGKTPEQVVGIFAALAERSKPVMATRASEQCYDAVLERVPDAEYDPTARMIYVADEAVKPAGLVVVASAGTADVPVGQEAALTARLMGAAVETFWDAGVAGIHRLLPRLELMRKAKVIVVVAGMEGALPSVVAGLVERPVIGVPTSVGYGVSFGGVTSLLGMLSSCAAGVSVVNIDNGFGAGYIAALINRQVGDA
jgi:NCAIR mutase (PurE)-related protein